MPWTHLAVQQLPHAGDGREVLGLAASGLVHRGAEPATREAQIPQRVPQGIEISPSPGGDAEALYQRYFDACLRRVLGA